MQYLNYSMIVLVFITLKYVWLVVCTSHTKYVLITIRSFPFNFIIGSRNMYFSYQLRTYYKLYYVMRTRVVNFFVSSYQRIF